MDMKQRSETSGGVAGSRGWETDWLEGKFGGVKNEDDKFREIWESGGIISGNKWKLKYWAVWVAMILFGYWVLRSMFGLVGEVVAIVVIVGMVVAYVKAYFVYRGKPIKDNYDEEQLYKLLMRVGAIKKTSDYSHWQIYLEQFENSQARYRVICREPGVDLFDMRKKLSAEAPKVCVGWQDEDGYNVYAQEVFIKKRDSANYTVIIDYRTKGEEGEIIDWFGRDGSLIPWEPKTNGVFGFGAIDKGEKYGRPCTGILWEHHIGVSGISGFGKSNMVHFLLYQLAPMNNVQIVYIDPQGTDGEFWRERAIVVSGRLDSMDFSPCLEALDTIKDIMSERAEMMKRNGWAKWKATPENPQIVVVVDEIKFLSDEDKQIPKKLAQLAVVARKFGISLIYATQYPKKEYVGGAWENLHYKVSSKTNSPIETQVVFGEKAPEAPCEKITEKGEFYAAGPKIGVEHIKAPLCDTAWAEQMAKDTAKYKSSKLARKFGQGDYTFTPNENKGYNSSNIGSVDDIFADVWK